MDVNNIFERIFNFYCVYETKLNSLICYKLIFVYLRKTFHGLRVTAFNIHCISRNKTRTQTFTVAHPRCAGVASSGFHSVSSVPHEGS